MKKFIMLTVLYGMFYGHANGMIDSEEAQKAEAITDSAMENEKFTPTMRGREQVCKR